MKTTLRRYLCCWVGAALSLAFATSTSAQMMTAADMMNPDELLYVIKVTPTLVYLDAGQAGGVEAGEMYMLLDEREGKDIFSQVAEVRVIRVDEEFSIAEILSVEMGSEVAVLQRAISTDDWDLMGAMKMDRDEMMAPGGGRDRSWSLHVIGGADLNKGVELTSSGDVMGGSSDSSFKTGFNGILGLHLPAGKVGWSCDLETGYQLVLPWNNRIEIDASNVRVHLGVGRAF